MLRIYLCIVFFLVEVAVISRSQDLDCTSLPSSNYVQARLQILVNSAAGGEGNDIVAITDGPYFTCQVQGTVKGTYQELSAIAEYTLNGANQTIIRQFELICVYDGNGNNDWSEVQDSLTTPTETDIPVSTNCSSCGPGNINRCQPCNLERCNVGLMRCTGTGSSQCCVAFEEDGMCKTDLNCTSNNFVANEQNNYTCACGLNSASCDPGYIFTNVTDCSCVLNDICMTQPPPCNSGSCILNTAPDNFTCNCSGTGFMGTNCTEVVSMSSQLNTVSLTTTSPELSSTVVTESTITDGTQQSIMSTSSNTVSVTMSVTPSDAPLESKSVSIPAIVISVIIGFLMLMTLIVSIFYLVYYFWTANATKFEQFKSKDAVWTDKSQAHTNPLYIKPEEVIDDGL